MVGTACLKDYTGISFEALNSLFGLKEVTDDGSGNIPSTHCTIDKYFFNVEELLCTTWAIQKNLREKRPVYKGHYYNSIEYWTLLNAVKMVFSIHCLTGERGVNRKTVIDGKKLREMYLNNHQPEEFISDIAVMRDWIENSVDPSDETIKWDERDRWNIEFEDLKNLQIMAHQEYVKEDDARKLTKLVGLYFYNIIEKPERERVEYEIELKRLADLAKQKEEEEARLAKQKEEEERKAATPNREVGDQIEVGINDYSISEKREGSFGYYVIVKVNCDDNNTYYFFSKPDTSTIRDNLKNNKKIAGTVKKVNVYYGDKSYQISYPKFSN